VIGQGFVQVVSKVPAYRDAVRHDPHELSLAGDVLEKHDQLQLEENLGIDARPAVFGVQRGHQPPDEREVQLLLQSAVEVVLGDELL
jgi:hypothetical protein